MKQKCSRFHVLVQDVHELDDNTIEGLRVRTNVTCVLRKCVGHKIKEKKNNNNSNKRRLTLSVTDDREIAIIGKGE